VPVAVEEDAIAVDEEDAMALEEEDAMLEEAIAVVEEAAAVVVVPIFPVLNPLLQISFLRKLVSGIWGIVSNKAPLCPIDILIHLCSLRIF
jgi:prophage DNA circulation protein